MTSILKISRTITVVLFLAWQAAPSSGQRNISADALYDKVRGMWLGQLIGNMAGRPTEGKYNSTPNPNSSVPWVIKEIWDGDDDTPQDGFYTIKFHRRFGDADGSGIVDPADLLILVTVWLETADHTGLEVNGDGKVNMLEWVHFAKNWLRNYP